MKYILWLWVIAWVLYLIVTSKPAIMAPCNTWVWDIYYKCNVQTVGSKCDQYNGEEYQWCEWDERMIDALDK